MQKWDGRSEGEQLATVVVVLILVAVLVWFAMPPVCAAWDRWDDWWHYEHKHPWMTQHSDIKSVENK